MIKLKIISVDGYNYVLEDKDANVYYINIEFYGLDNNPNIDDLICINDNLLSDIKNQAVTFGPIENVCGRKLLNSKDKDIIYLKIKGNETYLKRLYG